MAGLASTREGAEARKVEEEREKAREEQAAVELVAVDLRSFDVEDDLRELGEFVRLAALQNDKAA